MEENQLKLLIEKCLSGQASAEEQQMLDDWYQSYEEHKGLTEQLTTRERALTAARMRDGITRSLSIEPERLTFRKARRAMLAAATVLIIAGCWWFFRETRSQPLSEKTKLNWVQLNGLAGKVTKDSLPDGTVISINGAGSIRYNNLFNEGRREVWLSGEAYFDVVPQPEHPFLVHAGDVNTSVLGTEFNVKTEIGMQQVEVTVTEGRVAVEVNKKLLGVLEINDQLIYNSQSGKSRRVKTTASSVSAWAREELVFRETSFKEIAALLEKKFRVKIIFSNKEIGNCLLTASFGSNMDAEKIMYMLCKINGYKLATKNDTFIVTGRPCVH